MNDKDILLEKDAESVQSARVSHRELYGAIIAAAVCILLALVIWIGVMNTQDTDYIPIRVEGPEGYTYTLSVDGATVQGKVLTLKTLDEIVVTIPAGIGLADGTYYFPAEMLELPVGVTLAEEWDVLLTVTKN